MSNDESKLDIDVHLKDSHITISDKTYESIMYYTCPICNAPLVAYWKVGAGQKKLSESEIGRALRDSGFNGYRTFESENGQGFEYDFEKDPQKRHNHLEVSPYSYTRRSSDYYVPFLQLNPLFQLEKFFEGAIKGYDKKVELTDVDEACEIIEKLGGKGGEYFKVSHDKMKHGKPLLFFNEGKWNSNYGMDILEEFKKWGIELKITKPTEKEGETEEENPQKRLYRLLTPVNNAGYVYMKVLGRFYTQEEAEKEKERLKESYDELIIRGPESKPWANPKKKNWPYGYKKAWDLTKDEKKALSNVHDAYYESYAVGARDVETGKVGGMKEFEHTYQMARDGMIKDEYDRKEVIDRLKEYILFRGENVTTIDETDHSPWAEYQRESLKNLKEILRKIESSELFSKPNPEQKEVVIKFRVVPFPEREPDGLIFDSREEAERWLKLAELDLPIKEVQGYYRTETARVGRVGIQQKRWKPMNANPAEPMDENEAKKVVQKFTAFEAKHITTQVLDALQKESRKLTDWGTALYSSDKWTGTEKGYYHPWGDKQPRQIYMTNDEDYIIGVGRAIVKSDGINDMPFYKGEQPVSLEDARRVKVWAKLADTLSMDMPCSVCGTIMHEYDESKGWICGKCNQPREPKYKIAGGPVLYDSKSQIILSIGKLRKSGN